MEFTSNSLIELKYAGPLISRSGMGLFTWEWTVLAASVARGHEQPVGFPRSFDHSGVGANPSWADLDSCDESREIAVDCGGGATHALIADV